MEVRSMNSDEQPGANIVVRTRGAFKLRENVAHEASRAIRTRGAVHTRGATAPALPARHASLADLIRELRDQVGALPLTTVVNGWPDPAGRDFVDALTPLLRSRDAVWLVTAQTA